MPKVYRKKHMPHGTFWGNLFKDIKDLNFKSFGLTGHCILGFIVRVVFIIFGEIQDRLSVVQYTDVDYHVFTDGARHVFEGGSPYDRHTYRYSPILAYLLLPNVFLNPVWGKILFSVADTVVAFLIHCIVYPNVPKGQALTCAMAWLYNPVAVVIATRGNADSISAILVLLSVLLLHKQKHPILIGIIHGFSIHLRLYPIIFSLPMYLSLQTHNPVRRVGHSKSEYRIRYIPNSKQLWLVISCVSTLIALTYLGYLMYGNPFLNESILYHLSRRDIRHNYSVYFYVLYLSVGYAGGIFQKAVIFAPQLFLLLMLSLTYGSRRHLSFCLLAQSIVIVIYNPVMTTQYFVWFMSLIPPCIPHISLTWSQIVRYISLWIVTQLLWLFPAYLLEFKGLDTFIYIWLLGVAFFCVNIVILANLIKAYNTIDVKKLK